MRYQALCLFVLLLGGCAAPSGTGSPPATPTAGVAAATPGNNTAAAATAVTVTPTPISAPATPTAAVAPVAASTIAPPTAAPSSVPATAATSTPAAAGALTTTELKYRLIEQYGVFYCPAGGSPPTSNDEMDQALAGFALIQSDAEVFRAILAHEQLSGATGFTSQEKLLIFRDYRKLGLVTLARAGEAYSFSLRTMERLNGVVLTGSISPQGVSAVSGRQQVVNRCTG